MKPVRHRDVKTAFPRTCHSPILSAGLSVTGRVRGIIRLWLPEKCLAEAKSPTRVPVSL